MQRSQCVLVRRAVSADASGLEAILHDTFESTWLPNITPEAVAAFRRDNRPAAYVAKRGLAFWVAERDGAAVGFVDREDDFINALHVRAAHARTGIGGRLMDKAETEIAQSGFSTARLETDTFNTTSRAFYRARGYVETDQYPDAEWNSGLTTILLVKAVS